jgi:hypothetical protein
MDIKGLAANVHFAALVQDEEAVTQEQIINVVVSGTASVMSGTHEERSEWADAMRQLRSYVRETKAVGLAKFLGVIVRFVEGVSVDELTAEMPAEFQPDWATILRGAEETERKLKASTDAQPSSSGRTRRRKAR